MDYAEINWVDDQPHSDLYGDLYYSSSGGLSESKYVFIQQNKLIERFSQSQHFIIAEAGFGTGLNFIATCQAWIKHAPQDAVLYYVGIEKHPVSPTDIKRISSEWLELEALYSELLSHYPPAIEGSHTLSLFNNRVRLNLEFLDVHDALDGCRFHADVWYLDGFDPRCNTAMWNDELIDKIALHSKKGTSLATYTAAGHVRRRLEDSGFKVTKVKGHEKKREMITAIMQSMPDFHSSSPWYDIPPQDHAKKTAAVVGAGLAGMTTALSLVKNGWQVTLIDQHDSVANEASGSPAAILLPRISLGDGVEEQFYINAYLSAIAQLDELQSESDITFWHKTGVCSEELKEKADKILDRYHSNADFVREGGAEFVSQDETKNKVIYYPSTGWVDIKSLCDSIFYRIKKDVTYIDAKVEKIDKTNSTWVLHDATSVLASAEVVVLATGASLLEIEQASWLPVRANRGQLTMLDSNKRSEQISQAYSFGRFFTPQYKGQHYTGASYDLHDMSCELSALDQDENLRLLDMRLPDVFARPNQLTGRVGFRAVSEDRMPVVGLLPDKVWFEKHYKDLCHGRSKAQYQAGRYHDGLYVNAAHSSRGLATCFKSAELLVSIMEGSPLPLTAEITNRLNLSRFLICRLKRNQVVNG